MYNLMYKIKDNGYEIYKDEVLWISQYEPYIPNPSISYEENAIKHIEELNTPSVPNVDIENKISILENENLLLKESLKLVLAGDMYSLAKILYPEDFEGVCELK